MLLVVHNTTFAKYASDYVFCVQEMFIPIDLQAMSKRRIKIAVWHHRKTGQNVNMGTFATSGCGTW